MKFKNGIFIVLLVILMLAVVPSNAEPIYTFNEDGSISATENLSIDSYSATAVTSPGSAGGSYYSLWGTGDERLGIFLFNYQGSAGFSEMIADRIHLYFYQNDGDNSNLGNYVIPVNFTNTGETVSYGKGTLYLHSIGNYSGTTNMGPSIGAFYMDLVVSSWTPPSGTGDLQIIVRNETPQKMSRVMYGSGPAIFKIAGVTHGIFNILISNAKIIRNDFVGNSTIMTSKINYKFRNTVNGLKLPSNLTSIQVIRSGFGDGYVSISNVSIFNGMGYPLIKHDVGTTEVYVESYYPPMNITINDTILGYGINETWFPANLSIPVPVPEIEIFYPVTITDATTGNAIGSSWLNVDGSNTGWYNRSSSTGKFNITGKGTDGSVPLVPGDTMSIFGNATGYNDGGFYLLADNQSSGIIQYVNLVPESYNPIPGEFTAVFLTYDSVTSNPLSEVSVSVVNNGNTTTKLTGNSGSIVFTNLTTANPHQYTAIKPGYTTMTNNIVSASSDIIYRDVPMSPGNVNPTPSTTTYVTPTATISNIPTTSPTGPAGTYTGFWGPLYNLFSAMGATPATLNLLLAGLLIFIGVIVGAFGPGAISYGAGASVSGALVGGVFGFLMAAMFGFINPVFILLVVIFGVFIYFFVR